MRFLSAFLICGFVFLSGCSGKKEQSLSTGEPIVLSSSTDRTNVGVSEAFQFRIQLDYREDLDPLDIPEMGPLIQGLRILEPVQKEPVRSAGRVYKERIYRLMGDLEGSFTLPEVEIYVSLKDGEKRVKTPKIYLEIGAEHAADNMEDILEIDGLVASKFSRDFLGLWTLLGVLSLLVLGYFLYRQIGKEEILTVRIPAHEWALEALENLRARDFPSRGMSVEFCHQLSRILRGYLNRRFAIPAEESTLEELLPRLQRHRDLEEGHSSALSGILNAMDRIRFAGVGGESSNLERALDQVSQFIYQTAEPEDESEVVDEEAHGNGD